MRALVLGANEHPRVVACVRSLGRAGIEVIGVKSAAFPRACHSRLDSRAGLPRPAELGSNVYCESVHDEEAIDAATRLVKAVEYHGLITLEFRRDPEERKLIVIKADPRVVRPTSLSAALGMDTPTALYRLSVDRQVDAPRAYQEGVGWLCETMLPETVWNDRDARPIRRELSALFRRRGRIRAFAYFSPRDPLPFLVHAQWRARAWIWARMRNVARRCTMAVRQRITHRAESLGT